MIYVCQYCGKDFEKARKQKYCSFSCGGLARRKAYIVPCKQCGKGFQSDKSKKRIYCSKTCSGLARQREKINKICELCGKGFLCRACRPDVKYCSTECMGKGTRVREEIKCQYCQKLFYPGKKTSKFCSIDCKYAIYPRKGYKEVSINTLEPHEYFLLPMFAERKSCNEHRIVMARHIGRTLLSTEIVHHKNGVKRDNRIENLELLESKKDHHTGFGDEIYQELEEAKARILELEEKISDWAIDM